ncbi:MAG: RIP metalloprotease RseP [Gammaproteobacteria bacterium]
MTTVIAILAFVAAIGILVTIHEYGHFIVARLLGIKVLRFSVGFGSPLIKWVMGRDRTEYIIAAVPLGGYVKMLDERETTVAPEELSRAFNRQPVWKKTLVVLAGPAFNFLFALLAYWITFVIGIPSVRPVIGPVAVNSAAAHAGLRNADEIISIDSKPTPNWEATALALLDGVVRGGRFNVVVEDESGQQRSLILELPQDKSLTEPGALMEGLGISRWQPPAVLGEIDPEGSAYAAGLLEGDRIVSVDSVEIAGLSDWLDRVRANPGKSLELGVIRGGEQLSVPVIPAVVQEDGVSIGRVGVRMHIDDAVRARLFINQRYGPLHAAGKAVLRTWEISTLTIKLLGRMLTGDVSLKNISGPIIIAQYAGITASFGFVYYVAFLAVISVSLGVLNLLPIPVLDGGHLLFFIAEAVKGSPVSSQTEMAGQRIGILLLVLLMTVAFYNDIVRLLE